jgi:hypothetical protein
LLLLYSYTQVDLSLTLSRLSIWQTIEKSFQFVGYFQRPFSTALYVSILLFLFGFYTIFIRLASLGKVSISFTWKLICIMSIILFFSYNAFSYDLFNYIFDAKIFTHYHLNPYLHKALDFPQDPMLSFMHWTHRTYPYGPVWLGVTIPLSFLGLQYFLPTFFLFKLLNVGSFLGTVYFLDKILKRLFPADRIIGIVLFALNPLVLIESLVSGHNDIFMMFLAIFAVYLLVSKRFISSFLVLLLSIGVKFATVFLLPIFAYVYIAMWFHKKFSWRKVFMASVLCMIVPVMLATFRTTFQPWYMLFALPFGAFLGKKYYIIIPSIVLSFFFLLEYVPYLFTGNWDDPIPSILSMLTILGILVSGTLVLVIMAKDLLFARKTR